MLNDDRHPLALVGPAQAALSSRQRPAPTISQVADIQDGDEIIVVIDLFESDDLVPVLLQGGDAIQNMRKRAEELGIVMDTGTVAKG